MAADDAPDLLNEPSSAFFGDDEEDPYVLFTFQSIIFFSLFMTCRLCFPIK
jgi:hypothetical protein